MNRAVKFRNLFRLAFFLLALALFSGADIAFADGLSLYSYHDDQGQLIVVDSLDRVPEQYREQAQKSFIPSFRSPAPETIDQGGKTDDPRVVVISTPEPILSSDKGLTVVEPMPEEEPPDPAFASAALIIKDIDTVINNYERAYSLAFNYSFKHPAVMHHHLVNVNLIRKLMHPTSLVWREDNDWAPLAAQVIERLRTIQYTVSAWFETGSSAPMLTTLPTLTEAARRHLKLLTDHLKKLEEEALARAAEKAAAARQKRKLPRD